ncbi:MAG: FTR1 family protein [Fidelibacterota bacterium]
MGVMGLAEFLVTFRETLEAALVIGIVYTFLIKSGRGELLPKLWSGVVAALAASLVAAVFLQVVAGGLTGRLEEIFEGAVMILAAVLLTTMIVWMARNRQVSKELQSKAQSALTSTVGAGLAIFALAFVSVLREGIETVLFLYSVAINQGGLSLVTSVAGAAAAVSMGYLIFLQGRKVPLKTFFSVSSVLLILLAGGLIAHGIHEFEEAGMIPYTGAVWDINPPMLPDGRYPLFHEKGIIGAIAQGLFGWNGNPSLPEVSAWLASVTGITFLWKRASAG